MFCAWLSRRRAQSACEKTSKSRSSKPCRRVSSSWLMFLGNGGVGGGVRQQVRGRPGLARGRLSQAGATRDGDEREGPESGGAAALGKRTTVDHGNSFDGGGSVGAKAGRPTMDSFR